MEKNTNKLTKPINRKTPLNKYAGTINRLSGGWIKLVITNIVNPTAIKIGPRFSNVNFPIDPLVNLPLVLGIVNRISPSKPRILAWGPRPIQNFDAPLP
jgi:hypothetical protein